MTRVEKGETTGFMKAIADAEAKRVLGASLLVVEGDEAIHSILLAMNANLPYTELQRTVPTHPTVSELIPALLGDQAPIE